MVAEEEVTTDQAEVVVVGVTVAEVEVDMVEVVEGVTAAAVEEVTVVVVAVDTMVGEEAASAALVVAAAAAAEGTVADAPLPAATDGEVMELNLL